MKIIVFTRNGEEIPRFPDRPGLECQHIRFDSSALDDLLLVAQYKIIDYPTSLIIDDRGSVLMKIKGAIPDTYVDTLMESN